MCRFVNFINDKHFPAVCTEVSGDVAERMENIVPADVEHLGCGEINPVGDLADEGCLADPSLTEYPDKAGLEVNCIKKVPFVLGEGE